MTNRKWIPSILSAAGLLALILDSRTGLFAAREGVSLCLTTLVPSMFPFFIFSMFLTNSLAGQTIKLFHPIVKFCRIPKGAESLYLIGLLGGYPVGAQNVISSYNQGILSAEEAQRMAVFCNNAGPAFLFGYLGTLFDDPAYACVIWTVHIISSLLVGWVVPGGTGKTISIQPSHPISVSQAMNQSIRVMGQVCGWVVLFRVLIGFLDRWLLWAIPDAFRILLTGWLELSNGCTMLQNLQSNGLRFIFACSFLGFGGICVLLQTHSIAGNLCLPMYLPGKILQGSISFLLAIWIQGLLPDADPVCVSPVIQLLLCLGISILLFILRMQEKPVAISENLLYNQALCEKRRTLCCFGKKLKNPAPTALSAQN